MKQTRYMRASDFAALVPLLRISTDRVEAARLVLVERKSQQGVADLFDCSRQAVHNSVGVVWDTYRKYQQSIEAGARAREAPRSLRN